MRAGVGVGVDSAARAKAAALWAFRAGVELSAAARFDRLAGELSQVEADPTVVGMAQQAAHDERRHHRLCVELAEHLGASSIPRVAPDPAPVHLGRACPRERLLAEVVAMSCVTESLSAAMLVQMRSEATDAGVRDVVHEVLRDEVDHARLGWAHLAAESSRRSASWLARYIPAMLADTVHEELFAEPSGDDAVAQAVAGLGGLTRARRCELFVASMQDVVFPGLERFGVDTGRARDWLQRVQGRRASA